MEWTHDGLPKDDPPGLGSRGRPFEAQSEKKWAEADPGWELRYPAENIPSTVGYILLYYK